GCGWLARSAVQQLQRDLALETRVPCAIDRTERAAADFALDVKGPPACRPRSRGGAHLGEAAQLLDRKALVVGVRAGFRLRPIDLRSVGDGFGELHQVRP